MSREKRRLGFTQEAERVDYDLLEKTTEEEVQLSKAAF